MKDELKAYFNRKKEIYFENGLVMLGFTVVIPLHLRAQVLKQLHSVVCY